MSIKKIKHFWKQNNDTGFSTNATETLGGRFINKDGSYNLIKEGMPFWKRISIFHDMLHLKLWKFIVVILFFFIAINLIFTSVYYIIGITGFQGIRTVNHWQLFKELYYFSTETFTTVGYGRVNPANDATNIISGIESLAGLSSLAIATGLIYGRFSMPRSYLLFSEHALISPYKNLTGLMFRLASYKDMHTLTDVEVKINVGMKVLDGDIETYKYFALDLERNRAESMPMSWTIVHPINENSPFYAFKEEDMKLADVELYVMLRGFDDVFSNYVHRRTSYTYNEILFNRKFIPMYRENEMGTTTILELHKLNMHNNITV